MLSIRSSWQKPVFVSAFIVLLLGFTSIAYVLSAPEKNSNSVESLLRCYDGQDLNKLTLDMNIYTCLLDTSTTITTKEGYAHAQDAVSEVFATMYRSAGRYCAQVNEAMVFAAIENGESYVDLVNTHNSICTFAIVHAIGAYAVEQAYPGDATASVKEACSLGDLAILEQDTYSTQCWHGVGYGIERISKGNVEVSTLLCQAAPKGEWAQNCYDGIYEMIRHLGWTQTTRARVPYKSIVYSCTKKSFSPLRAMACYRNISISLTADNMYYSEVRLVVPEYLKVCLSESYDPTEDKDDSLRYACTIGYGMYAAIVAAADGNDGKYTYVDALRTCDNLVVYIRECYMRATMTLVQTNLRPNGVPVSDILAATPLEIRDWLNDTYSKYIKEQSGRSVNESY